MAKREMDEDAFWRSIAAHEVGHGLVMMKHKVGVESLVVNGGGGCAITRKKMRDTPNPAYAMQVILAGGTAAEAYWLNKNVKEFSGLFGWSSAKSYALGRSGNNDDWSRFKSFRKEGGLSSREEGVEHALKIIKSRSGKLDTLTALLHKRGRMTDWSF